MKRNPQAVASAALMQRLIAWRHWDDFLHHRHRKPWMWSHPILSPKAKPGPYKPGPLWVHPYITKRDTGDRQLRMIRGYRGPRYPRSAATNALPEKEK